MIYFRYRLLNLDSLIPCTVGAILVWYTRDIAGDRDVRVPVLVPIKSMKEKKTRHAFGLLVLKARVPYSGSGEGTSSLVAMRGRQAKARVVASSGEPPFRGGRQTYGYGRARETGRPVCWDYAAGRCQFGVECRFAHDDVSGSIAPVHRERAGGGRGGQ